MDKKYEFTGQIKRINGRTLHRIRAVRDFGCIESGTYGGWIEKEDNLSHEGDCWVADEACVYNHALVQGNAKIRDNAQVYDNAIVSNTAAVYNNASIEDAVVSGYARVFENASVKGRRGGCYISDRSCISGCASVQDEAMISGYSCVLGCAIVRGEASIQDHAVITDSAIIEDKAHISGRTIISGNGHCGGQSKVSGVRFVNSITVMGDAIIQGDFYKENSIFSNGFVVDGTITSCDDIVFISYPSTSGYENFRITYNRKSATWTIANPFRFDGTVSGIKTQLLHFGIAEEKIKRLIEFVYSC